MHDIQQTYETWQNPEDERDRHIDLVNIKSLEFFVVIDQTL